MLATIGLLPFWILEEVNLSPKSKPFNWLLKKYKVAEKKNAMSEVLSNVSHAFRNRLGLTESDRLVENFVCKWYRFENGRDGRFCDLFLSGQPLIKYENGVVTIIPRGANVIEFDGPIISSFTCGDFDIALSDVLRGIDLPGPRKWKAIEALLLPITKKTIHPVLKFKYESLLKPKASTKWMKDLWGSL